MGFDADRVSGSSEGLSIDLFVLCSCDHAVVTSSAGMSDIIALTIRILATRIALICRPATSLLWMDVGNGKSHGRGNLSSLQERCPIPRSEPRRLFGNDD